MEISHVWFKTMQKWKIQKARAQKATDLALEEVRRLDATLRGLDVALDGPARCSLAAVVESEMGAAEAGRWRSKLASQGMSPTFSKTTCT